MFFFVYFGAGVTNFPSILFRRIVCASIKVPTTNPGEVMLVAVSVARRRRYPCTVITVRGRPKVIISLVDRGINVEASLVKGILVW